MLTPEPGRELGKVQSPENPLVTYVSGRYMVLESVFLPIDLEIISEVPMWVEVERAGGLSGNTCCVWTWAFCIARTGCGRGCPSRCPGPGVANPQPASASSPTLIPSASCTGPRMASRWTRSWTWTGPPAITAGRGRGSCAPDAAGAWACCLPAGASGAVIATASPMRSKTRTSCHGCCGGRTSCASGSRPGPARRIRSRSSPRACTSGPLIASGGKSRSSKRAFGWLRLKSSISRFDLSSRTGRGGMRITATSRPFTLSALRGK